MPNFTNDLTDTVLGYGAAGSNAVLVTEQLFYLLRFPNERREDPSREVPEQRSIVSE
jgi:hypothetical protein